MLEKIISKELQIDRFSLIAKNSYNDSHTIFLIKYSGGYKAVVVEDATLTREATPVAKEVFPLQSKENPWEEYFALFGETKYRIIARLNRQYHEFYNSIANESLDYFDGMFWEIFYKRDIYYSIHDLLDNLDDKQLSILDGLGNLVLEEIFNAAVKRNIGIFDHLSSAVKSVCTRTK